MAVNQERQWNAYGGGVGFRVGGGMGTATSSTINIGTLGVDIYDSAAKQLVWRGTATKTLDTRANPQKRQENINKADEAPQELSAAGEEVGGSSRRRARSGEEADHGYSTSR